MENLAPQSKRIFRVSVWRIRIESGAKQVNCILKFAEKLIGSVEEVIDLGVCQFYTGLRNRVRCVY